MLKIFTLLLLSSVIKLIYAQDSAKSFPVNFSFYVDAYGAFYTDSTGIGNYQKFLTVSPRTKEIGLNIAMATAEYKSDRVRGIITLQYGDIPKSVWSETFNAIQEAHLGIRIAKDLWIVLNMGFTFL